MWVFFMLGMMLVVDLLFGDDFVVVLILIVMLLKLWIYRLLVKKFGGVVDVVMFSFFRFVVIFGKF